MSLTPAMKAALRKMTPDQIAAALQDAGQPRSTLKKERTAHGKIQKKDLVLVAAVTKAIRPLNSWIAYRSYYSTMFLSFQQKEISGFLTILWQNDPFKAKWSILAKSYSVIRDSQGKANAPLEQFLAINGPLIGVIEPTQYLEALSWEVAVDEDGQTVMRRNGNSIDEQLFTSNVSVNDVIRNSYDEGYFTGDLSKVLLANNEAAMTMAVSVQPTSNAHQSTTGHLESHDADFAATENFNGSSKEKKQVPTTVVIDDDGSNSAMATTANEAGPEESMAEDNDDTPGDSTALATENALPTGETSAVMTATVTSPVFDPHNLGPGSFLNIDAGMTEVQSHKHASANDPDVSSLSASAFHLDGEYPFNTEFDPDFSGATFNPFMGNQFNVFDMSDASWDDFIDFDASA
uniref:Mating type protein MAT1-1-1 n=1 Tax=Letharia aff. columbiana 'rugosa' TaxID=2058381 RepID=A0A7G3WA06_9LECA|nr:mating type protein MAT1-1-1 [Letharia aff. columbiana 'rugosa']